MITEAEDTKDYHICCGMISEARTEVIFAVRWDAKPGAKYTRACCSWTEYYISNTGLERLGTTSKLHTDAALVTVHNGWMWCDDGDAGSVSVDCHIQK